MLSVRHEPTKLVLVRTRTTYLATGGAGLYCGLYIDGVYTTAVPRPDM